jgi:hypothetical protein
MMAYQSKNERQAVADKMLADWSISGIHPGATHRVLLDGYVNGEFTIEDVSAVLDSEFGINQNISQTP